MSQRVSAGWTLYLFFILAAIIATVHSWSAGSPYFGNEFRTVELLRIWSLTDDEKTTWQGAFIDQTTGIEFESDVKPRIAAEFQREGSKPKTMSLVLDMGAVDPLIKERQDHFYIYRWIATGALVLLLFWWVIIQCPEVLMIFAIFSD